MSDKQIPIDRRRFLATTGLFGGSLIAGCTGGEGQQTQTTVEASAKTTGTQGGAGGQQAARGTFIGTTAEDAVTLDPRLNELAWVNGFLHNIFDTLFIVSPDGKEILPHLAAEQPTVEGETTYIFKIREGVTFHDGSELTAEDVAYSINWMLEPDNKSPNRANIQFIERVEATGKYEATFHLKYPFALFKLTMASTNAAIVPKKIAEEMGSKKFGRNPIGSGPFAFKEHASASHVSLTRNDDYWLKKPKLAGLKYRVIPKPQVQFVELATGGVHEATVPKNLLQKAQAEQDVELARISNFDYNGLIFNSMRKPFDDPKVREAMQYLVDYDALLKAAKGSLGNRAYGFLPLEVNQAWDFPWKEWKQKYYPPKNHEKAKQLLAEAGYGDGFDKPLKMSSLASSKFKDMVIIFQNELNQIGIEAEVREVTIGQWLNQLDTGSFDVTIYGWAGGQDPDEFYYYLFRDLRNDEGGMPSNVVGNAAAAFLYQSNPDSETLQTVDQKIRKARKLQTRAKRRELYTDVAETLQGLYPNIPVFSEQSTKAWSRNVKDYEPTAFSSQPFCNQWHNSYIQK